MEIRDDILDDRERIGFRLRELYHSHGFSRYRMGKFEEYDLYSRNKDFLLSDGVITFTDTNGRLMALKPDVTLSIVKNIRDRGEGLEKLYYCENVYRVSEGADGFREETQVGIECMGRIGKRTIGEVLEMAAESLGALDEKWVLEVSHLDLLSAMVDGVALDGDMRDRILRCAGEKNPHGISEICREAGLRAGAEEALLTLLSVYGPPRQVMPAVRKLAEENGCGAYARELGEIVAAFAGTDAADKIWIDFSATGDPKYYNGIAFKGFIEGIPDPVLSGGQYDALMRRMHRKDRAVGFAVFLNRLDGLAEAYPASGESVSRAQSSGSEPLGRKEKEAGDE
ncbi:MAG: ATP phosphoribosyltransferase regulatory subunit [Clostridia bacterium]|nr:ATP phosphoribosyltransferase regulatory subunit [Clostridia bacterium]